MAFCLLVDGPAHLGCLTWVNKKGYYESIFYVWIWFIIQLKQAIRNGCFEYHESMKPCSGRISELVIEIFA